MVIFRLKNCQTVYFTLRNRNSTKKLLTNRLLKSLRINNIGLRLRVKPAFLIGKLSNVHHSLRPCLLLILSEQLLCALLLNLYLILTELILIGKILRNLLRRRLIFILFRYLRFSIRMAFSRVLLRLPHIRITILRQHNFTYLFRIAI